MHNNNFKVIPRLWQHLLIPSEDSSCVPPIPLADTQKYCKSLNPRKVLVIAPKRNV